MSAILEMTSFLSKIYYPQYQLYSHMIIIDKSPIICTERRSLYICGWILFQTVKTMIYLTCKWLPVSYLRITRCAEEIKGFKISEYSMQMHYFKFQMCIFFLSKTKTQIYSMLLVWSYISKFMLKPNKSYVQFLLCDSSFLSRSSYSLVI